MNQNLKKIMLEENDHIADDYRIIFNQGFTAAIPHVREEILELLRSKELSGVFNDTGWMWADKLETELKRMDEE